MTSVVETVYAKFCKGDPLTNNELDVGIEHFRPLSDMLFRSGPVFRLAAQEANRVATGLEDYKSARNQK